MKALFRLCALSFIVFLVTGQALAVEIDADNANFQYSGRIDFSNPKEPVIYWPGTSIVTKFEGQSISILMNDQSGGSYYNVFVDDDFEHPYVLDCQAGVQSYPVPINLSDGVHSLLIFRRTEASTGWTKFLGVRLEDGKTLQSPPPKPQRRIEFYGNSITCGMGNEAPDNGDDDKMAEENNFLTYAALTARNLDAEYSCIAKSGIGIIISWFDLVMPDYYYRLNPADPNSRWDFSLYRPDVVVVNLFQNDSWLIKNMNPVPDSTAIVAAYVDFIKKIRAEYSDALIVCSLGSMDATKKGSPWPGYIEKAVVQMQNEGDENLATYFFPFKNWYKHPRVRHHADMAEGLTQFIGEKMGWIVQDTTAVEIKSDVLVPNEFELKQNYPNPFNPATVIEFTAHQTGMAEILVYDTSGRLMISREMSVTSGLAYNMTLNLTEACSGLYLYGVRMPDKSTQFRKMTLLK